MHPTYELTDAGDRYFDGLADKFSRSLYQAPRGELRLAMLDYLLPQMLHLQAQPVLDVGGGLGQLSGWFAARGHTVSMTEPSHDMLAHAKAWHAEQEAAAVWPPGQLRYVEAPLQALTSQAPGPWPLITCHAVLEWLGHPEQALQTLATLLAPGGQLSLMVFNRDALRFSNVVKGNYQKALSGQLEGKGKRQRLTPISQLPMMRFASGWARTAYISRALRASVFFRITCARLQRRQAIKQHCWRLKSSTASKTLIGA